MWRDPRGSLCSGPSLTGALGPWYGFEHPLSSPPLFCRGSPELAEAGHSRQVGRAPLEFGSFPEAVEGGEDHARKQLLNHLPRTPQATSVPSLGSFLHRLCRMPSVSPHLPTLNLPISHSPPLLAEKVRPDPGSKNSSRHSPAQSFHFQLGEFLTCSRFCSSPRT